MTDLIATLLGMTCCAVIVLLVMYADQLADRADRRE